jgi:hypothetical protein
MQGGQRPIGLAIAAAQPMFVPKKSSAEISTVECFAEIRTNQISMTSVRAKAVQTTGNGSYAS